jgi:hypothetical protein
MNPGRLHEGFTKHVTKYMTAARTTETVSIMQVFSRLISLSCEYTRAGRARKGSQNNVSGSVNSLLTTSQIQRRDTMGARACTAAPITGEEYNCRRKEPI